MRMLSYMYILIHTWAHGRKHVPVQMRANTLPPSHTPFLTLLPPFHHHHHQHKQISYPRWTYEALIINEFAHRADNAAVLHFYSFEDFNKYWGR